MFLLRVRACESDEQNIREVLEFHRQKVDSLNTEEARNKATEAREALQKGGLQKDRGKGRRDFLNTF